MSELSQYNDDGNVLTHGGLANRKPRGRKPLDYQDNKNKVNTLSHTHPSILISNFISYLN